MRIPLSAPDITEDDIQAVVSVLRTPRLSLGPKMLDFERSVADFVGVPHAVSVSSGTAGLHLCLRALGIGEGDEVILPSFTFIAAGNAVLYERTTPVFVDIDPQTLNLNPGKLEAQITSKTRAILVVHTFGYPADLGPILDIARKHDLYVIEDACEAIGAQYQGRQVGGIGDLGVFAFYPNKLITTGEGGMVVTRDPDLADRIRTLRNQGRAASDGWSGHRLLGYNYRLSEMNCALGFSQMRRLPEILDRREEIARKYAELLRTIPELEHPPLTIPGGRVCWFLYVVRLSARLTAADRDSLFREMNASGIECGRYFAPLHQQPLFAPYVKSSSNLDVTHQISGRTLALPFFNALTDRQLVDVCDFLRKALSRHA